ncbi:hypothetical protein CY34DRAFT_809585 [Suillus luteus UH-Slu-Lm8-n1]|uniref:Uncharacterized protein n=1 Tax=Suillus luteus UH-Slu-Lm8-n1 TaxID=930992 RepID=A0A0D0AJB0_9AGAM|nr:hypothetical protein CY34DRAFT_809585 [Suillus luteus UH-Slu-Lm8-n1]
MDASEGAGTLKTYTEDLHDIGTKLTGIGLVTSSNHDRKARLDMARAQHLVAGSPSWFSMQDCN